MDNLNVRQTAERLNRSEAQIRKWLRAGRFPGAHLRPGGAPFWLIPENAVDGFVFRPAGRPRKVAVQE